MTSGSKSPIWVFVARNFKVLSLVLLVTAGTVLLRESYFIDVLISIGIIYIMVMALDLIVGYTGQLAAGHSGFFAIGAYFSAIFTTRYGLSPWLALIVGVAASSSIAFLLGFIVFRTRHMYLAIMTLSFGLIASSLTIALYDITGGTSGLSGVPALSIGPFATRGGVPAALFIWAIAIAIFWLCSNLVSSRFGRALRSIHGDEVAAAALGVDLMAYKVKVFVLSAALTSIAGSLYVHYRGSITPDTVGLTLILETIMMLFLGGPGTLWGGLIGVALMKVLPQIGSTFDDYKIMMYAVIFILILFFLPKGIAGILPSMMRRSHSIRRWVLEAQPPFDKTAGVSGRELAPAQAAKANGKVDSLEIAGLSRTFGGLLAVDDLSFRVGPGRIQSLIGPNGAGKSTVLNLINGLHKPTRGEIRIHGRLLNGFGPEGIAGLGVGRTFQVPRLFDNMTVLENVMVGHHSMTKTGLFHAALSLPFARREEASVRDDSFQWLCAVGLGDQALSHPTVLSHGQKRWLELARVLACRPKLILLDEPTSGLEEAEKQEFRGFLLALKSAGITILLVEHDMNFVMGISDYVVVMNYGKKLAEGLPSEIRGNEEVIRAYLG